MEQPHYVWDGKPFDDHEDLVDHLLSPEMLPYSREMFSEVYDEVVENEVEKWHNDTHPGAYQFCTRRPCCDIRGI